MIRIIATFVLIYLIFRIFIGWILPLLVKWYVNGYRKRYYRNNPHLKQPKEKKKGDVNISWQDSPSKNETDRIGEYVDFEEVKENDKKK